MIFIIISIINNINSINNKYKYNNNKIINNININNIKNKYDQFPLNYPVRFCCCGLKTTRATYCIDRF